MSHIPTVEEIHRVSYRKDRSNRKAFCSCGHYVSLPLTQSRNAQVVMLMAKHLDHHNPSEIAKRAAAYMRTRAIMDKFMPGTGETQ